MKLNRGLAYNILVVILSMVILAGFTVGFVQHAIDENNKKFCEVLVTITSSAPQQNAPATTKAGKDLQETNRKIRTKMLGLQDDYKCERVKP